MSDGTEIPISADSEVGWGSARVPRAAFGVAPNAVARTVLFRERNEARRLVLQAGRPRSPFKLGKKIGAVTRLVLSR